MCNSACIAFGVRHLTIEEIRGKKVIEVGSCDVNGSLRPIIESWAKPSKYVGVDIEKGLGVDVICSADEIVDHFGKETFEIVISTELLEHVRNWKKVISNLKQICKTNGCILITTRSYGFAYHAYPYDLWRYELEDIRQIFSDCKILALEKDPLTPGVFFKVQKTESFLEKELTDFALYNITLNKRIRDPLEVTEKDIRLFYLLRKISNQKLKGWLFKTLKIFYS